MRNNIYEFLYLTRQERNGLLLLILSSTFIAFAPAIYSFFEEKEITDFSVFKSEIKKFMEADYAPNPIAFSSKKKSKKVNKYGHGFSKRAIELFPFDPNIASKEDFLRLGISPKTSQTIINFRNKGAIFFKKEDFKKVYGLKGEDYERLKSFIKIETQKKKYTSIEKSEMPKSYDAPIVHHIPFDPNIAEEKVLLQNGIPHHVVGTILKFREKNGRFKVKEDLKKIYTLDDEVYAKIEPYIQIVSQKKKIIAKASAERNDFQKKEIRDKNLVIDINQSSIEDWQNLRGIGPSFSKRIINYRKKLGGFYSIEQVGETYGFPDSTFQKIKPQLKPSTVLTKINLNQASEKELKLHPYFSWNQAKIIVSYRTMHGAFEAVNDLLKIKVLDEEWLEKVKHYLTI